MFFSHIILIYLFYLFKRLILLLLKNDLKSIKNYFLINCSCCFLLKWTGSFLKLIIKLHITNQTKHDGTVGKLVLFMVSLKHEIAS